MFFYFKKSVFLQPQNGRGVAQLVARYVRDVEAGSSSLLTPTKAQKDTVFAVSFFFLTPYSLWPFLCCLLPFAFCLKNVSLPPKLKDIWQNDFFTLLLRWSHFALSPAPIRRRPTSRTAEPNPSFNIKERKSMGKPPISIEVPTQWRLRWR